MCKAYYGSVGKRTSNGKARFLVRTGLSVCDVACHDMQLAGVSYTRRNTIKDCLLRIGAL